MARPKANPYKGIHVYTYGLANRMEDLVVTFHYPVKNSEGKVVMAEVVDQVFMEDFASPSLPNVELIEEEKSFVVAVGEFNEDGELELKTDKDGKPITFDDGSGNVRMMKVKYTVEHKVNRVFNKGRFRSSIIDNLAAHYTNKFYPGTDCPQVNTIRKKINAAASKLHDNVDDNLKYTNALHELSAKLRDILTDKKRFDPDAWTFYNDFKKQLKGFGGMAEEAGEDVD